MCGATAALGRGSPQECQGQLAAGLPGKDRSGLRHCAPVSGALGAQPHCAEETEVGVQTLRRAQSLVQTGCGSAGRCHVSRATGLIPVSVTAVESGPDLGRDRMKRVRSRRLSPKRSSRASSLVSRQHQRLPSELLLFPPGCHSRRYPPAFPGRFCEV